MTFTEFDPRTLASAIHRLDAGGTPVLCWTLARLGDHLRAAIVLADGRMLWTVEQAEAIAGNARLN